MNEKYQFSWFGKREVQKFSFSPATATLRPDKSSSKNWDTTQNIFIEGDNLEVLKILQKSYYKKIKLIYIDPPYNTGNEFVYKDDYSDKCINEKSDKKHSNWLNMMYSRLKVARELLKDDGVIFVSIDDNEMAQLRLLMDEIFGEENFLNTFCWINNLKGRQISNRGASKTHEYILAYAKNRDNVGPFEIEINIAKKLMPSSYKSFKYEVEKDEKGEFITKNELYNTNSKFNEETRRNLVFNIHYNFETGEVKFSDISEEVEYDNFVKIPPKKNSDGVHRFHAWRWQKEKIKRELSELKFVKKGDEVKIFTKIRNYQKTSLKDVITDISSSRGNNEIKELFGKKIFDYPKPVELLKIFISQMEKEGIVLDFFAGSGSTAHATMELNAEDGGNRKFILVQLPEPTNEKSEAYREGYKNICEIGKERLRRAGEKIKKEKNIKNLDIGFRVFKLDSDAKKSAEVIKRREEDLLFEIILKCGLPLSAKVEVKKIENKKVYIVENGNLIAVFDEINIKVAKKLIELLKSNENSVLFLRDEKFKTSSDKVNILHFFE